MCEQTRYTSTQCMARCSAATYLILHRRVLFLAGRIKNIEQRRLVVDHRLLAVAVLCPDRNAHPRANRISNLMHLTDSRRACMQKSKRTDRGVIVFQEVVRDQTDRQRGFTDTTASQHNLFFYSQIDTSSCVRQHGAQPILKRTHIHTRSTTGTTRRTDASLDMQRRVL